METYVPDNRFSGSDEAATTEITIASGHDLPALSPLGQIAASGKFAPWDPTETDGTEVASRLTAAPIDTTGGDEVTQAYKSGTFNVDLIEWDGTPTEAQKLTAFVGTPISLQSAG